MTGHLFADLEHRFFNSKDKKVADDMMTFFEQMMPKDFIKLQRAKRARELREQEHEL